MSLKNPAQTKKVATKSLPIDTRGTVGTFYVVPQLQPRAFDDTPTLPAKQYRIRPFTETSPKTAVTDRTIDRPRQLTLQSDSELHAVHDATKTVATASASDQFVFRGQGKSQKSLDRKNPPLTIEQVRDLLNKNK